MKASWSIAYLDRIMSPSEQHTWRIRMAQSLKSETGVPWSHYHANGKIIFRPYLDFTTVIPDSTYADRIMSISPSDSFIGLITFTQIAEETRLALPLIMSASLWLIKSGKVSPHVDRMGRVTFLKKR